MPWTLAPRRTRSGRGGNKFGLALTVSRRVYVQRTYTKAGLRRIADALEDAQSGYVGYVNGVRVGPDMNSPGRLRIHDGHVYLSVTPREAAELVDIISDLLES